MRTAVFEGRIFPAEGKAPFRNQEGLAMRPTSFGVRWVPGDVVGSWKFSYAWMHGQAVKRDGSVGTTVRWARYWPKDRNTMPIWLRQIATYGPHLARSATLHMAETDLTV